jgi:hypothetical protein
MRDTKDDLERAAAIISAHGLTDIADEVVDRGDLDWDEVTDAGVDMNFEDGSMTSEETETGLFVDVSEDDPFDSLAIQVTLEDGSAFTVDALEAEPGRYELSPVRRGE